MFMGVLALIVAGMAVITAVIPFRQILEQQARVESASAELARINLENELPAERGRGPQHARGDRTAGPGESRVCDAGGDRLCRPGTRRDLARDDFAAPVVEE